MMKKNLLIVKYPELIASEWDYEKNEHAGIHVNIITFGSHVKAWWHCSVCDGKYKMMVKDKANGGGCPFCAGKRVLRGYNDLLTCYPDLISNEWDYDNNDKKGLKPDDITCGIGVKASWRCDACKGRYEMTVNNKTSGLGCPYCSGHRVLRGFNDLLTKCPELIASEWDWIRNNANNLQPDAITPGSTVKACWHCNTCDGHYDMRVNAKTTNRQGCPYCAGRQVLQGFNDLASQYPKLIKNEWDWNANIKKGLKPDVITSCSHVKANWHCDTCDGRYEMMVKDKTNGHGCPFCAGRKVLKGFNDLASQCPELIESEWDWIKNEIKPDEITCHSSMKTWWRCSHDDSHSWLAPVYSRTKTGSNKSGCPKCSHRISKQEDEVASFIQNYLQANHADMNYTMHRSIKFKRIYAMKRIDTENILSDCLQAHLRKELDIYIPELNLAIEYDGDYWHNDNLMVLRCGLTNNAVHVIKQQLCKQACVKLLFITEHDWVHDNQNQQDMLSSMIETRM